MKTEKTHFTVDEIQTKAQAFMNEDAAVENLGRRPLTVILDMLDEISLAGLHVAKGLVGFLIAKDVPATTARPSDGDNPTLINAIDEWIDGVAESPMQIAAALVAQVPHMIAQNWKSRASSRGNILKLESAMSQLTALQLEADFRWMEETATETEAEPQESPEELEAQRVKDLEEDRLKLQLIEKYMDRAPIELVQLDGWDIGPEPNGHMTPDEEGHWICGGTTHELRRSPKDLRVRIFIPIDTDPWDALALTTKLGRWIGKIADSGKSFREEFDWRSKIRKPRKQSAPKFDDHPF